MRHLKNRTLLGLKRLKHTIISTNVPKRFVHENVPYFSQWESRELNGRILEKKINAADDPKWKLSGAKTKEEYVSWSWAACGITCLKMLLAKQTGVVHPIVTLGKKCVEYGGYALPLEKSNGLVYDPFVRFIKQEFHLDAKVISSMTQQEVINALAGGSFVIASVNPAIRHSEGDTPQRKGGHLILMLGYDLDKKEFYFHNPSGESRKNQEYAAISFKDFQKFFANRGIVISH
jgi:hypothetical protein